MDVVNRHPKLVSSRMKHKANCYLCDKFPQFQIQISENKDSPFFVNGTDTQSECWTLFVSLLLSRGCRNRETALASRTL
jgi:hypothetical protein